MFNRSYLKTLAKSRVKSAWGIAVAVALIGMLLCGGLQMGNPYRGFTANFHLDETTQDLQEWQQDYEDSTVIPEVFGWEDSYSELFPGLSDFFSEDFLGQMMAVVSVILLVVIGIALLYGIFVANVINTGMRGWFLRYSRGENASVGELFASFRIYLPVMVTNLLRGVYTFLWTLLFVIPGIVKAYAYSLTDYVIYENPNLSANQAITISRELTRGAKWDLFVLDLSFLGWNILSSLTFGLLGILYVNPYYNTAHAMVYDSLKMSAIQSGRLTWADFGQTPPVFEQPLNGGETN